MRLASRPHPPCRSGSPDPDLFGIGRSRTTEVGPMPFGIRHTPKGGINPKRIYETPSPENRRMARDRPSPYGAGGGVRRRDLPGSISSLQALALRGTRHLKSEARRGTGPRPTVRTARRRDLPGSISSMHVLALPGTRHLKSGARRGTGPRTTVDAERIRDYRRACCDAAGARYETARCGVSNCRYP